MDKKSVAFTKLKNLQKALGECGVPTMIVKDKDGTLSLEGVLQNSINGNGEPFTFFAEEECSYEINHFITPETDNDNFVNEVISKFF